MNDVVGESMTEMVLGYSFSTRFLNPLVTQPQNMLRSYF